MSEPDPWSRIRGFTPARVALGRAGAALPTAEVLRFALAHAQARDAVHAAIDAEALAAGLAALGLDPVRVESAALDRATYLARPDLGRRLSERSREVLAAQAAGAQIVIVVADGLSATAIDRHAVPLMQALLPHLSAHPGGSRDPDRTGVLGPGFRRDKRGFRVVIASQARVALGDEIGARLGARLVIVLIGERPGLSAPDGIGAYLTADPRPDRTDADRNCVSNIRPDGLPVPRAAARIAWLAEEALRRGLTGIALKDDSEALVPQEGKAGSLQEHGPNVSARLMTSTKATGQRF